jgi:hypothetical protein
MAGNPTDFLLMACHITGVYDVNRNTTLEPDDYRLVQAWAESVAAAKIKGVIFHNNLSPKTCETYTNAYVSFVGIDYNPTFNPNVFRYFVYRDYLQKHALETLGVFVTDVSDVVLVNNPFEDQRFINQPNVFFCGDEDKPLNNEWMRNHATHLREQIADYAAYEDRFGQDTLLNCGIMGGHTSVFIGFLEKLCALHERYNANNKTAYTGDMGAFNYLARTKYTDQIISGPPVNTVFKLYETERTDCWFRHK